MMEGLTMRKKIYAAILVGVMVMSQSFAVFAADADDYVIVDGFLRHAEDAAEITYGQPITRFVDDASGLVRISTIAMDYSVLGQISAIEPTLRVNLQAALDMINSRDARLLALEENRVIVEREEREINDFLSDNDIRGFTRRKYTVAEVQMLRAREAVRNQLVAMDINAKMVRAGNELQLRNAVAEISRAELDIVLLERQLYVEERNIVIVELMHDLGMESEANLRNAQSGLERTRTNLEGLQTSLANSRMSINTMLGLPSDTIVAITDLAWATSGQIVLETHVTAQLANAPNLALLQLDLDFAEYVFFSYDVLLMREEQEPRYRYRGRDHDPTIVIEMRNDISAAERALNNAMDSLENRVRSLYNDIEALREQQVVARTDLENAISDYQDAMLRYITGSATWLELERAMLAILNHEVTIARNQMNLHMLIQMYNHPYLN